MSRIVDRLDDLNHRGGKRVRENEGNDPAPSAAETQLLEVKRIVDLSYALRPFSQSLRDAYSKFIVVLINKPPIMSELLVPPPALHRVWKRHVLDTDSYETLKQATGGGNKLKYHMYMLNVTEMAHGYIRAQTLRRRLFDDEMYYWVPFQDFSPEFEVYVTSYRGEKHIVSVNTDTTMEELFNIVAATAYQQSGDKIKIFKGSERLEASERKLSDFGIVPGSELITQRM